MLSNHSRAPGLLWGLGSGGFRGPAWLREDGVKIDLEDGTPSRGNVDFGREGGGDPKNEVNVGWEGVSRTQKNDVNTGWERSGTEKTM